MQNIPTSRDEFISFTSNKIENLSGNSIENLELILRPGRSSQAGFIGENESLLERIGTDFETLSRLGVAHGQVANKVSKIMDTTSSKWEGENRREFLFRIGTRGWQDNPFSIDRQPTSSSQVVLGERKNPICCITEMHSWLIRELCFFQGEGLRYRIEPEKFIENFDI